MPWAVSALMLFSEPKPVAREFFSDSNLSWSTVDIA